MLCFFSQAALYIYEGLVRHTLLLLTSLTRRHSTIQNYLFGQLSVLLQLKVALPELADVLTEVSSPNPHDHNISVGQGRYFQSMIPHAFEK